MGHIKYTFSIKDLENFTGIKAHTIRMWERRYDLLNPERTEGNQRYYDLNNLQKLLNIKLLYDNGFKISKIASLEPEEIPNRVFDIVSELEDSHQAIDMLKMAMLNFDQGLFEKTYMHLISNLSFRRVFIDVFVPLLEHIGYLWQMDSITPAHEHFISNLIQQKILANIERIQTIQHHREDRVFVLYLPHNEIHELGLLYLHYELILRGWKSIYLGPSVYLDNLFDLISIYPKITFATYFTVEPTPPEIDGYMERVKNELLTREDDQMWILGRRITDIDEKTLPETVNLFPGLAKALEHLNT
ncbi:MAG: MerR family transcriptional regulator [Flavobacteriales bacterium]|nr:MerR family transcriptional regulator [Flavobacteriales bacterium]